MKRSEWYTKMLLSFVVLSSFYFYASASDCAFFSQCLKDSDCLGCPEATCEPISTCYEDLQIYRCNDKGGLYPNTICKKHSDCKSGECNIPGICLHNKQCPILGK